MVLPIRPAREGRHHAGVRLYLGIFLCLTIAPLAQARETITWLLRELPPLTIFEGPERGQGAVDKTLALLTQNLPEYDHVIQRVNRPRAMQMLQEPGLRCDPTLLWNPERARLIHFSIPSVVTLSNGLIIRPRDRALFAPFMQDGEVDLDALLKSHEVRVGTVAERSYGPFVDQVLKRAPQDALNPHFGSDAVSSLMQMQQRGRLQALIGYLTEARYLAVQQGMSADDFAFIPIKGVEKYQYNHVGCSNNPAGHKAIARINPVLQALRQQTLVQFYAAWLDRNSREQYLQDAKGFFAEHGVAVEPALVGPALDGHAPGQSPP